MKMYRFLCQIHLCVYVHRKIRTNEKNVKLDVNASRNTQLISFINLASCAVELIIINNLIGKWRRSTPFPPVFVQKQNYGMAASEVVK